MLVISTVLKGAKFARMYGEFVLLDAHLGKGIGLGKGIVTMAAPLLLTSGPEQCEAFLHHRGTSLLGGGGGRGLTCDSAHSWKLCSAASLGH